MDYLSNNFIYKSQPEIISQDVINTDDDKKEKNFLTDEQIQNLLENYENKSNKKNKNLLFIILFIFFFLFIFWFIIF
jgi:hypothetical protein